MPAELCLLTDEEMLRRVENLPNLNPIKQDSQVSEMGNYFALIGAPGDAVKVWDLGDKHLKSRFPGWWVKSVRQFMEDPGTPAWNQAEQLEAQTGLPMSDSIAFNNQHAAYRSPSNCQTLRTRRTTLAGFLRYLHFLLFKSGFLFGFCSKSATRNPALPRQRLPRYLLAQPPRITEYSSSNGCWSVRAGQRTRSVRLIAGDPPPGIGPRRQMIDDSLECDRKFRGILEARTAGHRLPGQKKQRCHRRAPEAVTAKPLPWPDPEKPITKFDTAEV